MSSMEVTIPIWEWSLFFQSRIRPPGHTMTKPVADGNRDRFDAAVGAELFRERGHVKLRGMDR